MDDPSVELPRDSTGRYLHLRLKRFHSINDLSMKYAKETWNRIPHDAEFEGSSARSSSCRWCRESIPKGSIRFRLWLQCHKGCKNSAYFHEKCFYEYPETAKLGSVQEVKGFDAATPKQQTAIRKGFQEIKEKTMATNNNDNIKDPKDEKEPSTLMIEKDNSCYSRSDANTTRARKRLRRR